jgi:glycosyltransferase involved in cell wall biosynthesis
MNQRMVWLTNRPAPYRRRVWSSLVDHGFDLTVCYSARPSPARNWHAWPESSVPFAQRDGIGGMALLRSADVCVISGWHRPGYWLAAALAGRRPTVIFYESTLSSHRFRGGPVAWVRGWFFRRADAVLTAGPAATEAVLAMGVSPARVVTAFNAVDVTFFHEGAVSARSGAGVVAGHHVLYVGQLIERKNVAAALRAWAGVRGEEDTFTVVGSGPLRAALERLAAELGLADRVRFLGHLDGAALVGEYARAQTFVLPSTEEVWGLVVNEALAAGLHAVVSSAAGVARSVEEMPGVFTCPPTEQALAAALRESAQSWTGPIADPPILAHTPGAYADAVIDAVRRARHERRPA